MSHSANTRKKAHAYGPWSLISLLAFAGSTIAVVYVVKLVIRLFS